jgi:hypothetical protein
MEYSWGVRGLHIRPYSNNMVFDFRVKLLTVLAAKLGKLLPDLISVQKDLQNSKLLGKSATMPAIIQPQNLPAI